MSVLNTVLLLLIIICRQSSMTFALSQLLFNLILIFFSLNVKLCYHL